MGRGGLWVHVKLVQTLQLENVLQIVTLHMVLTILMYVG